MANEGITRRDFIKGLAAGAVSIAGLGVLQAIDHNAETAAAEKAAEAATAPVTPEATSGLTFTPGTYEASAKGIASDVKVKMTFDEKTITDCSIDVSGECTMCLHEKYWSHRYTGGKRGSMAAFIMLEGNTT